MQLVFGHVCRHRLRGWVGDANHGECLIDIIIVSYSERLKRLKLDTLELRRLHIVLTLCLKICNGYVPVALDKNDFLSLIL